MGIGSELLDRVAHVAARFAVPPIRRVYIPEPHIAADKDAEFGLIELESGAAGLFYAWLGDSQRGISTRFNSADFEGRSALEVARYFADDNDMSRSVGLAAINAITSFVYETTNTNLPPAPDSMAGIHPVAGDRLGFIGNFPSLVRAARADDVPVTVVERKTHMLREEADCLITNDPSALRSCNKIICTAATLINNSIDAMLPYLAHAELTAMIGPSAGFFPEPVFASGFDVIGGTIVTNPILAIENQRRNLGIRNCTRRYLITRSEYRGFELPVS